ncbi:hypothetical protein [Fodinibius sediminis]|uniref:Uncharacterized protein n=1 Tax=Fodinibius sediminis TaxID=1214077 RepID=A0A521EL03_9BACT|nr:hypothetical protein [Fodinibius sediminis]SMO84598.1 hypothetical protein SAMN06265218_11722 [Fodinibius sediminis]
MNTFSINKRMALDDVSKFDVKELDREERFSYKGGALSGGAAIAAAAGGGLAAIGAGVLVGVAIYYGVKWMTN